MSNVRLLVALYRQIPVYFTLMYTFCFACGKLRLPSISGKRRGRARPVLFRRVLVSLLVGSRSSSRVVGALILSSISKVANHRTHFEAKPRGLLFSFFIGVPCLFWEIIVVMVIFWCVRVKTTPFHLWATEALITLHVACYSSSPSYK